MINTRRYPRIRFAARCVLHHTGCSYEGKVVNISLGGAMIGFDESVMVPQEEKSSLVIFVDGLEQPQHLDVEVIYSTFFCMGVKFIAFDEGTCPWLYAEDCPAEYGAGEVQGESRRVTGSEKGVALGTEIFTASGPPSLTIVSDPQRCAPPPPGSAQFD